MGKSDKEWKKRTLCSDGNCIGIIGADGRCKECGLPYDGELPTAHSGDDAVDDSADDSAQALPVAEDNDDHGDDAQIVSDASDDSWENRTLCVDESCIGVVGPDGRCKECGTAHPGSQS